MTEQRDSVFSMAAYERIIRYAQERSYKFVTLNEFIDLGCPDKLHFVIRHDVDKTPTALLPITEVERNLGVRSTTYIRVCGAEYNPFSYPAMKAFLDASNSGAEIGLHTGCFEYATINGLDPLKTLKGELDSLRAFFDVKSIAPHRDINYIYNSLPFIEKEWNKISTEFGVKYHAYEQRIMSSMTYVNEGFNPHLCWRTVTPNEIVDTGGSVYLLTHPHWWYKNNPFEAI